MRTSGSFARPTRLPPPPPRAPPPRAHSPHLPPPPTLFSRSPVAAELMQKVIEDLNSRKKLLKQLRERQEHEDQAALQRYRSRSRTPRSLGSFRSSTLFQGDSFSKPPPTPRRASVQSSEGYQSAESEGSSAAEEPPSAADEDLDPIVTDLDRGEEGLNGGEAERADQSQRILRALKLMCNGKHRGMQSLMFPGAVRCQVCCCRTRRGWGCGGPVTATPRSRFGSCHAPPSTSTASAPPPPEDPPPPTPQSRPLVSPRGEDKQPPCLALGGDIEFATLNRHGLLTYITEGDRKVRRPGTIFRFFKGTDVQVSCVARAAFERQQTRGREEERVC